MEVNPENGASRRVYMHALFKASHPKHMGLYDQLRAAGTEAVAKIYHFKKRRRVSTLRFEFSVDVFMWKRWCMFYVSIALVLFC